MLNINKFSMGATAAIITSMGLIAGLTQGVNAKISIITGLLIIAVADNISDSFSIHIYKESEGASDKDVSSFTIMNFTARLFLVLTFVLIVLFFTPFSALVISSIWGLILLATLSYLITKDKKTNRLPMIARHLLIALLVIAGSKLLGNLILKIATHS
jgi:VIT1/CCC1 family predicted Fe2+/Mn2+ transporter